MIDEIRAYFDAKDRRYWEELNGSLDRLRVGVQSRDDLRVILSGLESEEGLIAYRLAWHLCDLLAESA